MFCTKPWYLIIIFSRYVGGLGQTCKTIYGSEVLDNRTAKIGGCMSEKKTRVCAYWNGAKVAVLLTNVYW